MWVKKILPSYLTVYMFICLTGCGTVHAENLLPFEKMGERSFVQGIEMKYNHDSIRIEELVKMIDFQLLIPKKSLSHDCSLEIKTYPEWEKDDFTKVRLHYMDNNDKALLIGIEQTKSTNAHVSTKGSETVDINGNKGFFNSFANAPGGILSWNHGDTSIEMDSNTLTKKEMLEIAQSMEVAK